MNTDPQTIAQRRVLAWLRRLGLLAGVLIVLHLDLGSWNRFTDWISEQHDQREPLERLGPLLLAKREAGARVYLLTARTSLQRSSRLSVNRISATGELQVDLWCFEAATLQPVWVRRLLTEPEGRPYDLHLYGLDGDRLWFHLRGLIAVDADSGEIVLDEEGLVQRNPALAGRLKPDARYYGFDAAGLYLTDDQARQWRIDGATAQASAVTPTPASAGERVVLPAKWLPIATNSFKLRGIELGKHWLGLLSDADRARLTPPDAETAPRGALAQHEASMREPRYLPLLEASRYRLWQASIRQVSAAPPDWPKDFPDNWGLRNVYGDWQPLPVAPEFLDAGLLFNGRGENPLWAQDPDSVFVLDRERVGNEQPLYLSRIAGPDGRVVWRTELPISVLQSVLPHADHVVLFGRRYPVDEKPVVGDPYHRSVEWLVSVDLASGALHSFAVDAEGRRVLDEQTP